VHGERSHGCLRPRLVAQPDAGGADITWMDDSFSYRTTQPPGPRFEPWVIKSAVAGAVVLLGIALFARWVVASERESFARGARQTSSSVRVGQIEGTGPGMETDADAEEATRVALAAARAAVAGRGTFLAADPARLADLQPGYTFVDGPSTTPRIVSIAAERHAWAAAALGPSGTCFWIRLARDGSVESGTASTCSGAAVLVLPRSSGRLVAAS
jgi:hypothetical protein